jgi:hypothetical protein
VKTCQNLGLHSEKIELPAETTTEQLLAVVEDLNNQDARSDIINQAVIRFERLPESELDADLHFGAAMAYLNLRRPGEALSHLRLASRLRPQDVELAAGVE